MFWWFVDYFKIGVSKIKHFLHVIQKKTVMSGDTSGDKPINTEVILVQNNNYY